jgi:hypothetical protein
MFKECGMRPHEKRKKKIHKMFYINNGLIMYVVFFLLHINYSIIVYLIKNIFI